MQVQVVDYRAPDAAEKFTRSLHETGFGVLTNHPIRQALVEKIYADWLAFFNGDGKEAYAFSKETQDGWFSTEISETAKGSTHKDIKEYFHIYPWGRIPPQLKEDALAYYREANEQMLVIALLEDAAVLDNLDAILAVPGIDLYGIGPHDFSQSLGYPGQPDHPDVVKAMQEIVRRVHQAGGTMQLDVMEGPWITEMLLEAGRRVLPSH